MTKILKIARMVLGIIFIWYGALKFFPSMSPAEVLATKTINILFFSLIPPFISIKLLAIWEVGVGLCFLTNRFLKLGMIFFFVHMTLTFTPFLILPHLCFTKIPYAFTIVGQYILKNTIFILMGILIYKDNFTTKENENRQ